MAAKRIKKKHYGSALTRSRHWIAVGALAAYSAGAGTTYVQAQSRAGNPTVKSQSGIQALPPRRYDIAPGSMRVVLPIFENLSQVKVKASDDNMLQISTPGLQGVYTVEEALKRLLTGTSVQYRFDPDGRISLRWEAAPSWVTVNATADHLPSSLPKYQTPLLNTPQTATVVSKQTMEQQGTTTLRDALRNVAGISLAAGEGGAQGDNLTIRGFTARNDLFVDGIRDFGSYYRDPFNLGEVEVLQGPSSVTFGRGSTGGVVNQASKIPELNRFISGDMQFGTDATRRGTLDISVPLSKLGHGTAFRLNLMGEIGDVAGRDVTTNRRAGFAPSIAFGLGSATRLTLSVLHQNENDIPDYGLPWYFDQPAAVNHSDYYGLKGNYLRTNVNIGTAKLEHDLNSHVVLRNQIRYADYQRDAVITEAQIRNVIPSTPLSQINVFRNEISVKSVETLLDDQFDAISHFSTGKIQHTLVSGFEALRESSDPTRFAYTAPGTSLLNPNNSQQLPSAPTISSQVNDTATGSSAYVLDSASLGKHFIASGGVRYDRFDNTYRQNIGTAVNLNRVDFKPTWRAALVYKPVSNGSIYVDAGTSFNPSAESLSLTAGSAGVPPESNKTYEAGTKWDFNRSRLQITSAAFQTTKENAREADPTNALLVVVSGTQRVRGVQAAVTGHLTNRWDIMSSYAYLDSRVANSRFYPLSIGYPLANVPGNNFNLWSNHRLARRFEFGVGTNYLGRRNASSTVPLDPTTGLVKSAPSYWVFNAMLSHPINEHLDLQLNGYNLANRYYYDQLHPGHIVPGPGRSLLVGLKFKF